MHGSLQIQQSVEQHRQTPELGPLCAVLSYYNGRDGNPYMMQYDFGRINAWMKWWATSNFGATFLHLEGNNSWCAHVQFGSKFAVYGKTAVSPLGWGDFVPFQRAPW